jgi:glycosyltransferase involved in cell wall biosynthesis
LPKVALFSNNFLEYSQTFVYDEVRSHDRYAVHVFTSRRLNAERFPYEPVHAAPHYLAFKATTICPTFDRVFRRERFDLIHAHFGPGAVYALPYAMRHDLPLVVTFHGYDVPILLTSDRFKPEHWRYWLASFPLFRRIDRFLAASLDLRELLLRRGADPERVFLYHLGVDVPAYRRDPVERDHVEVVMIGRFVEKKGHEFALRAVARARAAGAPLRLVLIGSGPLQAPMKALAAELGLMEGAADFIDAVPHAEVQRRLAQADVVIAPSVTAHNGDRESGILVLKEAGAASLPTVGTHHGGIPEIIDDGVTGFIVPERDVEALADRLLRLARDPDLRTRLGAAARLKMEREYDLTTQVRRDLAGHYDAVLAARGRRSN